MRYKLEISYNGKDYHGFQYQPDKLTIQEVLENKLLVVVGTNISVVASGRTDAGVSAISQICHFDCDKDIDCNKIVGYINHLLPQDIRVININKAKNSFHARYSAKKKTYEYLFYIGREIPVYDEVAVNIGYNLNINKMKDACKHLIGTNDFSCFCASNTEVKDKVRTIFDAKISKLNDNLYKFSVTGNGFLYNMVRIIMGTLVSVGMGKLQPEDICSIIKSLDRNNAGKTMPSKGLYLKKVVY